MTLEDNLRTAIADIDAQIAHNKLQMGWVGDVPPSKYASSFYVPQDRLDQACRLLRIKHPVKVFIRRVKQRYDGQYNGLQENGRGEKRHSITLRTNLAVMRADVVLYHELMHAKQCERAGSYAAYHDYYDELVRRLGLTWARVLRSDYGSLGNEGFYRKHPLEREAVRAEHHAIKRPIVRQR